MESKEFFAPVSTKEFNLIDENWIKVVGDNGVQLVSLKDCILNSEKYSVISGELSIQDFAIFRLILGVVRSAIRVNYGILTEEIWKELWSDKSLFNQVVEDYLDDDFIHSRFYLFHPDAPFYQVSDMESLIGKVDLIENLVLDAPTSQALMTFKDIASYENGLTFDEAARWLIGTMSYDKCGAHTGVVGDSRVSTTGGGKNRSYPKKTNLALFTAIQLNGTNLFETIMLNTVPMERNENESYHNDYPIWELDPIKPGPLYEKNNERTKPFGTIQLLTWQPRRIRLFKNGDRVTHSIITNGDALDLDDTEDIESMASYRKRVKDGVHFTSPFVQDKNKSFWRGFEALLQHSLEYIPAKNVAFISKVRATGILDKRTVRVSVISAKYDVAMSSSLTDVITEINPIPTDIFGNPNYESEIINALNTIDDIGKLYWIYGRNCSLSLSSDENIAKKAANAASVDFYHNAENVFYDWLFNMANGIFSSPQDELTTAFRTLLLELVIQNENKISDTRAIIGRNVDGKNYSLNRARKVLFGSYKRNYNK